MVYVCVVFDLFSVDQQLGRLVVVSISGGKVISCSQSLHTCLMTEYILTSHLAVLVGMLGRGQLFEHVFRPVTF